MYWKGNQQGIPPDIITIKIGFSHISMVLGPVKTQVQIKELAITRIYSLNSNLQSDHWFKGSLDIYAVDPHVEHHLKFSPSETTHREKDSWINQYLVGIIPNPTGRFLMIF